MMKKCILIALFLFLAGCIRHYEVPITVGFEFPDCTDCEECLDALKELNFENMIHIEVKADVEKPLEIKPHGEITGGKLF